jgi:chromosome segregation ATPase
LKDLDAQIARLVPLEAEVASLRQQLASAGNSATSPPKEAELRANLSRTQAEALYLRQELAVAESKRKGAEDLAGSRERELEAAQNAAVERDKALKELDAEISRLAPFETEVANLRQQIASASPVETELKANLERAQGELAALRQDLDVAEGKRKAAEALAAERQRELDAVRGETAEKDKALAEAVAERTRLNEEVARLAALAREAEAKAQSGNGADQSAAGAAAGDLARELTPRDPVLVATAMQETPGLAALDNEKRDRLATGLIEGECVAKSLADVFGRAPAPTVRDLIQKLQSDC